MSKIRALGRWLLIKAHDLSNVVSVRFRHPDYASLLIYGLQRSGTNYLEAILQDTFEVAIVNGFRRDRPSHKHFRLYGRNDYVPEPQFENDITINSLRELELSLKPFRIPDYYIVISKSPYSWYLSYDKWARSHPDWQDIQYHYIQEWNLFYGTWFELAKKSQHRILMVRYIDLLKNLQDSVNSIGSRLGLRQKRFEIRNPAKVSASDEFTADQRDYYLHKQYLEFFSEKEMNELNSVLDRDLAQRLGYSVEEE